MTTREALKQQCLALLDENAVEHPIGHQGSYAARYVLRSQNGTSVEIMFEKNPSLPANLWLRQDQIPGTTVEKFKHRFSAASGLNQTNPESGKNNYGRHSALRPMPALGHADLVCITLQTAGDLQAILAVLKTLD